MNHSALAWIAFIAFVAIMLFLDLAVFHKKEHEIKMKEAVYWSVFWVSLALFFCYGIYYLHGRDMALKFLTGYLVEESLSVDNLFVFLVIFEYFKVAGHHQHRVLFWGILGALILRAIFIFSGVALINRFHWVMYLFGIFLVFTGIKLIVSKEEEVDPSKNPVLKIFRRFMPVTDHYHGNKFFVRENGLLYATPLIIVLLVIETTDLLFAVDSIPAVLSISTDTFIVFTSNIFAIMGLRSMFFALAGLMKMFEYLSYGLGIILSFVGVKMLVADFFHIPTGAALSVIVVVLAVSIILSILHHGRQQKARE